MKILLLFMLLTLMAASGMRAQTNVLSLNPVTITNRTPDTVTNKAPVPLQIEARNNGQETVSSLVINLSVGLVNGTLEFSPVTSSLGQCQQQPDGDFMCNVGTLQPQQSVFIDLTATPALAPDLETGIMTATTTLLLQEDPNPPITSVEIPVIAPRDFGDAPAGYPVTWAENGARHRRLINWWLGAAADADVNGVHSSAADHDDLTGALPDDEDGVVIVSGTGTLTVDVTAARPGRLDAWMDFNRNTDWADAGEQILASEPLPAGTTRFSISAPAGTSAGPIVSRWRFSETGGLSFTGFSPKGEVEDHIFDWQPEGPRQQFDFGDADDPTYPTLLSSDGARHLIVPGWHLGATIDAEADGQPTPNCDGDDATSATSSSVDDEDGVRFLTPLIPGGMVPVEITASTTGRIDAWIDWNQDGTWQPAEQILAAAGVLPGINIRNIPVPPGIPAGETCARFRYSQLGGLGPRGAAPQGEVEDYRLEIPIIDFDLELQLTSTLAEGDEANLVDVDGIIRNVGATTAEDVTFTAVIVNPTNLVSIVSVTPAQGTCEIVGDRVTCDIGSLAPQATVSVDIQVIPDASGDLEIFGNVTGSGNDVNPDNNSSLFQIPVFRRLDYGDARDPSYPTLLANNGARHRIIKGYHLGTAIDREPDGQPSPQSNGDDLNGATPDDEDGIVFVDPLVQGTAVTIQIVASGDGRLDAWIDFNRDGTWQAAEQIFASEPIVTGVNTRVITIPSGIPTGNAGSRFRFSKLGGLSPVGYAPNGEVEDHHIEILPPNVDIVVDLTSSTTEGFEGIPFNLQAEVQNLGPGTASDVNFTLSWTPMTNDIVGLTITPSQGTCEVANEVVTCSLGTLAPQEIASVFVDLNANLAGFVEFQGEATATEQDANPEDNAALVVVPIVRRMDYGDAPDPTFPTLLASNGARHRISGLFLGATIDAEPDGLPSPMANGDDMTGGPDDEDGVFPLSPIIPGGVANFGVIASGPGLLQGWIDFNRNGAWDPAEQVFANVPVVAGPNTLSFPVPAAIPPGYAFARFRLSTVAGLGVRGYAENGEVEDYKLKIRSANPWAGPDYQWNNGRLTITWHQPDAVLEQADTVFGPWQVVATVSPFELPHKHNESGFFRLRVPEHTVHFEAMLKEADLVLEGVVESVEYRNSTPNTLNQRTLPHTFVTFRSEQILKGGIEGGGDTVTLRFVGGLTPDGEKIITTSVSPHFDVGETSLLFVHGNGRMATPLVDNAEGRFRVTRDGMATEGGQQVLWTEEARVAFGDYVPYPEVVTDTYGNHEIQNTVAGTDGETQEAPYRPTNIQMTKGMFVAYLNQLIELIHTPEELKRIPLTPSLDPNAPFFLPGKQLVPLPDPWIRDLDLVPLTLEHQAWIANGCNPVLP